VTENTLATPSETAPQGQRIAAIDMGSNSFHMVVAQEVLGEIRILDKMGEKVQLAAGIDANGNITSEAKERALACLSRFAQRIGRVDTLQIVGTNALRIAKNSHEFIESAEQVLDHPIEVIAGREEARLIYLGVSHTLSDDGGKRLVIDIGGGSTEFIIGERFEPIAMESLHMGCVSYQQKFFNSESLTESAFKKAETQAALELLNISQRYKRLGWENAVGSSGSIKAIYQAILNLEMGHEQITPKALSDLKAHVIKLGSIAKLQELNIKKDRLSIFASGLSILIASFDVLGIQMMTLSDGALREGLLYDVVGRTEHEDVRSRTISALQERYHVDKEHAKAVEATTLNAFYQVRGEWGLDAPVYADLLKWACRIHEMGLAISHTQFHKHGGYLLNVSDLPGFSNRAQRTLAILVRAHRRKLNDEIFQGLSNAQKQTMLKLVALLRLGVLLQRPHSGEEFTDFTLKVIDSQLYLTFPKNWLNEHSLTLAGLESERDYLNKMNISLHFE
jgi:exopolyphosphatase/guanosine-5'-triphosphate,3'-diphosphate pyrophosphatase